MARPYRAHRYGPQPIRLIIAGQLINRRQLSDDLSIKYPHLARAIAGTVRPHPWVVDRLCDHFKCAPTDLFTSAALGREAGS